MGEKPTQAQIQENVAAYLKFLFNRAVQGDIKAGAELSVTALGGSPTARKLVEKMDTQLQRASAQKPETKAA